MAAIVLLISRSGLALDKQGSAHGGGVEGPTSGFAMSGSVGASFGTELHVAYERDMLRGSSLRARLLNRTGAVSV